VGANVSYARAKRSQSVDLDVAACQAMSGQIAIGIIYVLLDNPMDIATLSEELNVRRATLRYHLQKLIQGGLVRREKQSNETLFALSDERLVEVLRLLRQVLAETLTATWA